MTKALILFPLFVMFIFCVISVADSGADAFNNTNVIYSTGVNYTVLSNGTVIFTDDDPYHYLLLHHEGYSHEKGDVIYNITWEDIESVSSLYHRIFFKNGTVFYGSYPTWYGTEYFYWESHDWWLEYSYDMTYYQYLANLTAYSNSLDESPFKTDINVIITPEQGAILTFVGIIALIGIIGIKVFGSGLSNSISLVKGIILFALWGVLSAIAQPMISAIFFFGTLIYLGLTFMYLTGYVLSLNDSGD